MEPSIAIDRSKKQRNRLRSLSSWILAVAALVWMVFGGLATKGICYYDEAFNVLEARFVADAARLAGGFVAGKASGGETRGLRDYVREHGRPDGYYPQYGKPVHTAILAVGLLLGGVESPRGAHWAVGLCALLWLLAQWRWTALLAGEAAGRWSALLLGGSAYFLIYARQTLAETTSVCLLVMGLWGLASLRLRAPRHPRLILIGIGILTGLSFAANYRWFWIPLLLVADVVLMRPRSKTDSTATNRPPPPAVLSRWTSRLTWLGVGFALPLLILELPGLLLRFYFLRVGLPPPFETYWQQVARLYFFHPTSDKGFDLSGLPTYFYLLWRWTSPLWCAAVVAGGALLWRRRHKQLAWFLTLPPLVMLGFYSVYTYKFARFATLSLPFLAALAGIGVSRGMVWGEHWFRRARGVLGNTPTTRKPERRSLFPQKMRLIAGLLILSLGLPAAFEARAVKSVHGAAADWMRGQGGGLCASTDPHVMRVVYGRNNVLVVPSGLEDAEALSAMGVRWVVLGPLRRYWGEIPGIERLQREHSPVFSIPDPALGHEQYAFEHNRSFRETRRGGRFVGAENFEVYDLGVPVLPSEFAP